MKKYQHLYDTIHQDIASGELAPGMQLPTEAVLAEKHQMSRQTVRKALSQLQKDGLIYSIQGSGSYISYPRARSSHNKRIAVITTYFSEYIFPSILRGISDAAFENGYSIEIHTTNNSISIEKTILNNILENPVAGIIVEGTKAALPNPNTIYYQQLSQKGLPIVFINSIYPQLKDLDNIISVVTEDFNGGYQLAQQLIAEGQQQISCIFKSDDAQGINRFAGVLAALSDNNIEFDDRRFIWFTTETKHTFMQSIVPENICSAIICYNDEIAAILSSYLKKGNHHVSSIASFDRNINPEILPSGVKFYSLAHPKDMLGKTAANKLFNMLGGRPETSATLPWVKCTKYTTRPEP